MKFTNTFIHLPNFQISNPITALAGLMFNIIALYYIFVNSIRSNCRFCQCYSNQEKTPYRGC